MLIPSIDIMNGKAVQLRQGIKKVLCSDRNPVEIAREFNRFGIPAVIDLDAAMGRGDNIELVKEICRATGARAGGGIRSLEKAQELLRAGASRLILGTALWDDFVIKLPREKVQAALDTRNGTVMTHGWKQSTGKTIEEVISEVESRAGSLLCTFIETEGTMRGLSSRRITELQSLTTLPLTVAGGIKNTENAVSAMKCGVDVQVGMSLYTGKLDPTLALSALLGDNVLYPTVTEDQNGQVLMLAWSNCESLRKAVQTGKGIYYSRSRKTLWEKGETSGNTQQLQKCRFDCDSDTLLFTVQQKGNACHSGSYSCFGDRRFQPEVLREKVHRRKGTETGSYTSLLLKDPSLLRKKLMEEAAEVAFAENLEEVVWEAADLMYFLTVLLEEKNCSWDSVMAELEGRSLK